MNNYMSDTYAGIHRTYCAAVKSSRLKPLHQMSVRIHQKVYDIGLFADNYHKREGSRSRRTIPVGKAITSRVNLEINPGQSDHGLIPISGHPIY